MAAWGSMSRHHEGKIKLDPAGGRAHDPDQAVGVGGGDEARSVDEETALLGGFVGGRLLQTVADPLADRAEIGDRAEMELRERDGFDDQGAQHRAVGRLDRGSEQTELAQRVAIPGVVDEQASAVADDRFEQAAIGADVVLTARPVATGGHEGVALEQIDGAAGRAGGGADEVRVRR